jgi:hypothetical protein
VFDKTLVDQIAFDVEYYKLRAKWEFKTSAFGCKDFVEGKRSFLD